MTDLLAKIYTQNDVPHNPFASGTRLNFFSKSFETSAHIHDSTKWAFLTMNALLENGDEKEAVKFGQFLLKRVEEFGEAPIQLARRSLALAYLREGEKTNCILDHSGESCIFPIAGRGIQNYKNGSRKAIVLYEQLLEQNPSDVESRWLLNIAYMAIGGYPRSVPKKFLIPDLDKPSAVTVKPFEDMSMQTGLNVNNLAGGSIIDDFNNDGHPDIITSSIHLKEPMLYHQNNGDGTFKDVSLQSGLGAFTGGLNLLQNDYNNDGLKDIFVLRGAWLANYGEQPNSLLRNNGDGTFTDVTVEAGILSFRPTQTATWADFNGDGWLDLFIGNETTEGVNSYPCELYVNNKNGTFFEIAKAAGCDYTLYVKGVTSGDYNNDDKPDLYLATLDGNKILLKNETEVNGPIRFTDVSDQAGLNTNITRVFTSWFWDYDNDGWLDILSCGYEFQKSLAWYAAQEALDMPMEKSGEVFLFRNKHDGTFEDVSDKVGFDKTVFAMGGNFGDINNDGYLDFYLGSGNPLYQSLVPNKMYLNIEGSSFVDVTTSARVGNLQKGHAVSFADLDNDGDQDIHIEMGGAFDGDAYANSLFINPGQADNHWIKISLEGILANKAAIGAKLRLTIEENGKTRMLYREVNSGGSFGSNPLMQSIGVGKAEIIKKLEIIWPGSKTVQVFTGINVDQNIYIRENSSSYTTKTFPVVSFTKEHHEMSKHVH
ncbi:MAG: CRTAC1 family protein [Chitinophagaceae bacterium]|nr:CRTAC1 family protein [Chitinophagaceae bacterium]